MPPVLVAVVNKNGHPHFYDCVSSLMKTDYSSFNVVLFDNGSTDGSFLVAQEILRGRDNFLLLRSRVSIPLTRALNLAIGIASRGSKYVALLDSDVVVQHAWLDRLTHVMESDEKIGSCQSLLLTDSKRRIDSSGDFVDFVGNAISRDSQEKLSPLRVARLNNEIFSARSAAMIVRRDLFWRIGEFDESFEINFEDVDFGWRIRLAGFSNRLVPDSLVVHRAGSSTGTLPRSSVVYQGTKNRLQMLLKNYELRNLVRYALVRLMLDLFACVLLFLARRRHLSMAVLRGLAWNLAHIRGTMANRAFVQTRIRGVPDSSLLGRHILRRLIISPVSAWRLLSRES